MYFGDKVVSERRRRRKTIFDIFDDLLREIEEEFQDFIREIERFGVPREEIKEIKRPFVYGFRITIGPDGIPRIEEFGNVRRRRGARPSITEISEEREPLVDVLDEGDKVRIIAEMPGVEKDKIKLKVQGRRLIIRASNEHRKYYKEVDLPTEVDIKRAKATYRNGVLEVEIPKVKSKGGEFEIKIE